MESHLADLPCPPIAAGGCRPRARGEHRTRRPRWLAKVPRHGVCDRTSISSHAVQELGEVRLSACYHGATDDAGVGGDLYAVMLTRFGTRLLIGDARGMDPHAARLASVVLAAFEERADDTAELTDLCSILDEAVASAGEDEDFVTAVLAQIDDGSLELVIAGHPPPLLIRDGTTTALGSPNPSPPLGLQPRPSRTRVPLNSSDRLLFYTDGISEARQPDGAFFPLAALAQPCLGSGQLGAAMDRLWTAVAEWTCSGLNDDAAVLVLELSASRRCR